MRRLWIVIGLLTVLLCGGGLYALRLYQQALTGQATGKAKNTAQVTRGDLVVTVVETGNVDAVTAVEVKSRVAGRVAQLLVEEGDLVREGQLIAVIDPRETELRVRQDEAQLKGAMSGVQRAAIEIQQRRITSREGVRRAKARLAQIQTELRAQPRLSDAAVRAARDAQDIAQRSHEQLISITQPNERAAVQSELRQAEANVNAARSERDRRAELLRLGYISQRDYEEAVLQYEVARSRLDSAQERAARLDEQQRIERDQSERRIRQAQAELDRALANQILDATKRDEYASALAELRQAEAALRDVDALVQTRAQGQANVEQIARVLDDSRRQLGETEIRAPISGIVSAKYVQVGELVASLSSFSSGTPIVRIEDRTRMMVKLDVNEIDVAKLRIGMPARINVDALPDRTLAGTIRKIAPTSTNFQSQTAASSNPDAVVKYEVEVWFGKHPETLRSGMSAKCTMETLRRNRVLTLPIEFVRQEGSKWYVEVLPEGSRGSPRQTEIKVGATTGSTVEILSGISEGATVARPKFSGPQRRTMIQMGE